MAIKKSKSFWLMVIFINTAVVSVSGYIIYTRLNTHFAPQIKTLRPTPVPVPAAMKDKPAPLSDEAREFLTMTGSTQITDKKALSREKPPSKKNSKTDKPSVLKETPKKVKALKTIFRYKNLKAKSVSVAGSFTKWNKIKMKKKKGIWQANIWILPGTYLFHYVVDGKKVLDSSLPKADIGESVIDAGN